MLQNTANMGRFGDTEMAHVSPGEVVVPRPVLENNPNLGAGIATAIENMGGNPERYVVGSQSNSINPDTGNPEYFWKELLSIGKSIFGSKAGQDIITNVALQKLMGGKVNAGQALASGLVGGLSGDSGFFGESGGQQKPKTKTVATKASNAVESIAPVAKRAKAEGTMGIGSLLGDAVAGKGKDNFLSNLLNSKGGEALLFGLGSTFLDKMFGKEEEEPGRRPFGGTTEFRPILGGYNYGGQVYQRRDGGIMPSEGSGTEDDVPAMLTAGEFVLTKKAVEGLGNGNLDRGIQNGYKLMNNLEGKA